jgi:hypothetical protein
MWEGQGCTPTAIQCRLLLRFSGLAVVLACVPFGRNAAGAAFMLSVLLCPVWLRCTAADLGAIWWGCGCMRQT